MENTNFKNERRILNNIEKIMMIGGAISFLITKVYLHVFYFTIGASLQIIDSDKNAITNFLITFSMVVLFAIFIGKIEESTHQKIKLKLTTKRLVHDKKTILERVLQSIYISNYGSIILYSLLLLTSKASLVLIIKIFFVLFIVVYFNFHIVIFMINKIRIKIRNSVFVFLSLLFYYICIFSLLFVNRDKAFIAIIFYFFLFYALMTILFYLIVFSMEDLKTFELVKGYKLNLKSMIVLTIISAVILPASVGYMHASFALPGAKIFSKYNILLAEEEKKYLILKNTDNYFLITELQCSEESNGIKCNQKIDTSMLRYVDKTEYPIMKTTINWSEE